MKLTFQTFCLFVLVTMVHLVVLAGISRITDEPSTILSDLNGEEILEEIFGGEGDSVGTIMEEEFPGVESSATELAEAGDENTSPADLREGSTNQDRSAERGETSAIVDARMLSGRADSPDVADYVDETASIVKPTPEMESDKEEPAEPRVESKPKQEAVAEKVPEKKDSPALQGPHVIRSIRPL